jgi:hypothetical protein
MRVARFGGKSGRSFRSVHLYARNANNAELMRGDFVARGRHNPRSIHRLKPLDIWAGCDSISSRLAPRKGSCDIPRLLGDYLVILPYSPPSKLGKQPTSAKTASSKTLNPRQYIPK